MYSTINNLIAPIKYRKPSLSVRLLTIIVLLLYLHENIPIIKLIKSRNETPLSSQLKKEYAPSSQLPSIAAWLIPMLTILSLLVPDYVAKCYQRVKRARLTCNCIFSLCILVCILFVVWAVFTNINTFDSGSNTSYHLSDKLNHHDHHIYQSKHDHDINHILQTNVKLQKVDFDKKLNLLII